MPRFTSYPRGFVLGRRPFESGLLPGHYRATVVVGQWHFAHDPVRSPVLSVEEATGRFVLVHGSCYPVGEDPVEDVSGWLLAKVLGSEEEFLDALDVLAGRHVVVVGDPRTARVYQDAIGSRSVYYSPGAELVASHAHLIHDLVPHPPTPPELLPTTPTTTWDLSPWDGIRALVPNHALTVGAWTTDRFFPRRENPYTGWTAERRLAAIEAMWRRHQDALIEEHDGVVVSVTGGADSRVVLAMARQHLPRMTGFTYTSGGSRRSQWARMLSQDERIVGELREVLPMHHEFFARGDTAGLSPELTALLDRNSLVNHGRWLIPHYNRLAGGENAVHLRGNALEIGRAYNDLTADNDTVAALRKLYAYKAAGRTSTGGRALLNDRQRQHFDESVTALGYQGQLWGYHRLDLLYWEQRCGRWLSEILNETDVSFDSLMPVNIRAVLDLLLSFGLEDRRQAFAYAELVNRNFPVLNFFGKNEDRNLYEQLRDAQRTPQVPASRTAQAWLEEELTVLGPDGEVLETGLRPDQSSLHLPLPHFRTGRSTVRRIGHDPVDGSLGFTFHSPYTAELARPKFAYRFVVAGTVLAEVDGAAWDEESRVTVHNVAADDTVEVHVVALATMDRKSWEAASRAHVTDLRFVPRPRGGPPRVASSDPYTVPAG